MALLRLAWCGFARFRIGWCGCAGGDGPRGIGAVAHKVEHEWCDFERHLLAFRHCAHWLALDEVEPVAPRIQLHASADRKRRDHLRVLFLIDRSRCLEIGDDRYAIAEVSANQIWDFLLPRLQRRQE